MTIFNFNKSKINNSVKLFNPQKHDRENLPLLIYLPGMDGTGKLLSTQIEDLKPHFNLRCLSISPTDLSTWKQLTTFTIDCLQQELSVNKFSRIYLCGESFGGCLAMLVTTTAPQIFDGTILINAASSFNQQPILSLGINLIGSIPEWLHRNSAVNLLPFLAALNRIEQSDRLSLLNAMKYLPQNVVSWRLSLLRDFMITPSLCYRFKQPTLIIASACDRLLPSVKEAFKLQSLFPNSRVEILPNSGHACLLETDVSLASILSKHDFLIG